MRPIGAQPILGELSSRFQDSQRTDEIEQRVASTCATSKHVSERSPRSLYGMGGREAVARSTLADANEIAMRAFDLAGADRQIVGQGVTIIQMGPASA
jgi:hypothetical protein